MIKFQIAVVFVVMLFTCCNKPKTSDYFNQVKPGSTPVKFAPGIITLEGRLEHGLAFSPDNKEVAFGVLNNKDFSGDILYAVKNGNEWTNPTLFIPLKEESVYLPYFSSDGESLVYAQSKPDTNNGFTDIFIISRENESWGLPEKIEPPVNSMTREANACMALGGTIYFSSNRDGNGLADLFCSKPEEGNYMSVEALSALNSNSDEESIFIAPDESYIIFSRYSNEGAADLFISYTDVEGNWMEPMKADSTINSKDWDRRPFVSADNKFLFFTRLQIGDKGLTESDIYWVGTQKLFKPYVYNSMPDTTIKVGNEVTLRLPENYFKDVDGEQITLELLPEMSWLEYNKESLTLTGIPCKAGDYKLKFKAIDESLNTTYDTVIIKVIN